jgi:hypothetical protein
MPSPFPGMDPFLEEAALFAGFHARLINECCRALLATLRPPYYADINDRVWIDVSGRNLWPDVNVLRDERPNPGGALVAARPTTRPVRVRAPSGERRQTFIEIFCRRDEEHLVAAIEILSPSNKSSGEGRDKYLSKQRELLDGKAHLIEIDLLRGGAHTTAVPQALAVEHAGPFDYHACVHACDAREDFLVYPVLLPDRLPVLEVPLLPGDGSVALDLQAVMDSAFDSGPYRQRVRYAERVPPPALSKEQQTWVEQLLREKGVVSGALG